MKFNYRCMNKLNLISVAGIVAAVSLVLVVGMTAPVVAVAFAQDNMTMNMDDNMSSVGNMTGGGNATFMTETESLPSANETGDANPAVNLNLGGLI